MSMYNRWFESMILLLFHCPSTMSKLCSSGLGCILGQNLVQPVPLHAVLELEASSDFLDLLLGETNKVVCPLFDHELTYEDVARDTGDAFCEFPDGGRVQEAVLLGDLFEDVVDEGLVDVSDSGVVGSPGVDGQAVLLGEEVFE